MDERKDIRELIPACNSVPAVNERYRGYSVNASALRSVGIDWIGMPRQLYRMI